MLLFLSWSFYQDAAAAAAAAAERKINVGVNDELEDIIEGGEGGRGQELGENEPPAEKKVNQNRVRQTDPVKQDEKTH